MELMMGIDEIDLSDSLFGLSHRLKKFINFKNNRQLKDKQDKYSVKKDRDNLNLLVTYIGIQSQCIRYQRFVYGYLQMLSKVGGLFVGLHKVFVVIVMVVCHVKFNSKLIAIINSKIVDMDGDLTETEIESQRKLKQLSDNSFLIKFSCWKGLCCSSKKLSDKCFKKEERIKDINQFYEVSIDQINH